MTYADPTAQPIVIRRIVQAQAHHGGSWKVAFADFATAMMAFFLLLWLIATTTEEQKGAIAEYFNSPSAEPSAISMPLPAASLGQGGSSDLPVDLGGGMALPSQGNADDPIAPDARSSLELLRETLETAIAEQRTLGEYADHLLLDITPEGLRLQVVDQDNRSMFALGSSTLQPFAVELLAELAGLLNEVPNLISISGYTDSLRLNRRDYSNWELSADRANAARRALLAGGLDESKLGRVVGLGSTMPLLEDSPEDAVNRRISILVMTESSAEAMRAESQALLGVQHGG